MAVCSSARLVCSSGPDFDFQTKAGTQEEDEDPYTNIQHEGENHLKCNSSTTLQSHRVSYKNRSTMSPRV